MSTLLVHTGTALDDYPTNTGDALVSPVQAIPVPSPSSSSYDSDLGIGHFPISQPEANICSSPVRGLARLRSYDRIFLPSWLSDITTNELLASKLALVETKAAIGDAKMIDLEKQVLSLRETVAGEQLAALKKSAADTSAEGEGERRTFQLGNARSNKRGAPADAETSSSKRTKLPPGVGEKSDYPVWAKMLGLAANVTGTPVNIFSRMVKVALVVEKFELPSRVFVERNKAGTELSIGFLKTSEAQALVRAWGDEPNRAFADVKVVMDKDSSAGMTYGMYKHRRRE
ncbi:hypothetical protein C8F04DRAFT_1297003 [Mycena alexandri]|uniref:Uncharacterized protein n=1 Tax=Mycena alexandri TaxID=1745969 RepID=A0AAD6T8M8_9AGAR|nr:hypothetical protein C8F04DRAFT_1297003 [Mycena alexandri]